MTLALVLSTLVGVALGLFGGGGSMLSVPLLTYSLGMSPKSAIATSLLVIAASSAAALVPLAGTRLVYWRTGVAFGLAGMAGAYAGGHLSAFVPGQVLLWAFTATMLVTAFAMLRRRPAQSAVAMEHDIGGAARMLKIASYGLGVGALTGMIGAGGGFLIVPVLTLLGRVPMRSAVATSLLVISMNTLAGFAGHVGHAEITWNVALPVTGLAMLGSLAGSVFGKRLPQVTLRRGFAWLVISIALFVIARELPANIRESAAYQAIFVARWTWWIGGAALALVVLGLLLVENKQLGVSTGCSELCELPRRPELRQSWRPRFLLGIVLGGALSALFARRTPTLGMGSLDALVASPPLELGLLFGAGILIGLGSRLAGGCTSGHGIVGTALGARSSWLATTLFMASGFLTTQLLSLVVRGLT